MPMNDMQASYDLLLVALSYLVSVFGAYTSLRLALRMKTAEAGAKLYWLTGAALAMGGGAIWAMHFIGMLAFKMSMPVQYDLGLTLLSMVLAMVVTGVGLWIVGQGSAGFGRLIASGVFMGLGVAGMHYLGMYAMRMPASLVYNQTLVALSLVIAVVAGTAALWLAFNMQGTWKQVGSALVMGAAVCGMHYTGMAAATMQPNDQIIPLDPTGLTGDDLAFYVSIAAVAMLAILLFTTLREKIFAQPLYKS